MRNPYPVPMLESAAALSLAPDTQRTNPAEADSDQPRPIITQVTRLDVGCCVVTAITRRWDGDDAARCGLCPAGRCTAYRGSCTVLVDRDVPIHEAKTFDASGVGAVWQWAGRDLRVVCDGLRSGDGRG